MKLNGIIKNLAFNNSLFSLILLLLMLCFLTPTYSIYLVPMSIRYFYLYWEIVAEMTGLNLFRKDNWHSTWLKTNRIKLKLWSNEDQVPVQYLRNPLWCLYVYHYVSILVERQFLSSDDEVVGFGSICLDRNAQLSLESQCISFISLSRSNSVYEGKM